MIELSRDGVQCLVSAQDGARIAALRIDGAPILVEHGLDASAMSWGWYPMVPFAGRIRDGRFTFAGREHQLPINLPPHAIHGYGYTAPWTVTNATDTSVEMHVAIPKPWPFGGTVAHRVELGDRDLTCRLIITAADEAMPAQVGWHPWFIKPAAATLRFARMYRRDDTGIPDGTMLEPPPPGPWDDCFVEPLEPLRLTYASGRTLTIDSDCDRWVVYDQPAGATCVEPQSGPPDGFNCDDPTAAEILSPGGHLTRWMRIQW